MKLFVLDKDRGEKVFLRNLAPNRESLARQLGGNSFEAKGTIYRVKDVVAEKGSDNTSIGMVVGGVIGALGGGAGVAAGSLVGALLGKAQDAKEDTDVEQFNRSIL